jgi:hypothetical protein
MSAMWAVRGAPRLQLAARHRRPECALAPGAPRLVSFAVPEPTDAPVVLTRRLIPAAAFAALAATAPLGAQTSDKDKKPVSSSVEDDIRMAQESAPFREVADAFIAAAMAGDTTKVRDMLSPNLVGRMGAEAVDRALGQQILPFFAAGKEVGRSVTIAGTTDAHGSSGFAYYMWLVPQTGEQRPFSVYVVNEGGKRVVANVVPDRLVEGRHQ